MRVRRTRVSRPSGKDGRLGVFNGDFGRYLFRVPSVENSFCQFLQQCVAVRIGRSIVRFAWIVLDVEELTRLAVVVAEFPVAASYHPM